MSADITPAGLAKFVHRVPVGAVIPAGTPYAYRIDRDAVRLRADGWADPTEQKSIDADRWTAEPILAAEQQRLEDEREEAEALRPRVRRRLRRAIRAERIYRELQKAGRR